MMSKMFSGLVASFIVNAVGQDLFLSVRPSRAACGASLEPSTDPFQELCYLLYKNGRDYTISWTPPHAPPALFQDHIAYDLVTLWKLGANAAQLNASYEFHLKHEMLQPLNASTGKITESNWNSNIGRNSNIPDEDYPDYLDFYRKQISQKGLAPAIAEYLPSLVGGGFSKLYHGQQMLGWSYAETADEEMAAQGLAWMSAAYHAPAPLAAQGKMRDLMETFAAMHADARLPTYKGDPTTLYYVFLADLVANHSTTLAEYDLVVSDWISSTDAKILAKHMHDAAFQLFAACNFSSFTHIHMISSARAVANLVDILPSQARAELLRRQWQATLYNFAIQSRPCPTLPTLPAQSRSWTEILAGTMKQTEYHLHELVLYAQDNYGSSDPRLLQVSADRALALIESGGKWAF